MNTIEIRLFKIALTVALFASAGLVAQTRAGTVELPEGGGSWNGYGSGTWSSAELSGDDGGDGVLELYMGNQWVTAEDGTDDWISASVTDISYDSETGDYWGYINYSASSYTSDVEASFTSGDYVDLGTGDAEWDFDGNGDAEVTVFGGDDQYYTSYDGAVIVFN